MTTIDLVVFDLGGVIVRAARSFEEACALAGCGELALARDEAGALPPLPIPLPDELTPRLLPDLTPIDLNPPYEGSPRRAVVVALLVPPVAVARSIVVATSTGLW